MLSHLKPTSSLQKAYLQTSLWVLLWLSFGSIQSYILRPYFGIDGTSYWSVLFFAVCASLAVVIYKVRSVFHHHMSFTTQVFAMSVVTVVIVFLGFVFNAYFPLDQQQIQKINEQLFSFPQFQINTWAAKWADVSYQQIMLFALLNQLSRLEISKKDQVLISGIGFAVLHLPLVLLFGWRGFYFIIPSTFAGFIFTYLITYKRFGLFYSYSIHMCFYLVLGIAMRLSL